MPTSTTSSHLRLLQNRDAPQILPIANFQIRPGIAASFLRRGIRLFSFQKSPAVGELDDSHVTPTSSLNILRYGVDSRMLVPPSESDQNNVPDPGLGTATARKSDLLLIIAVSINGCQGFLQAVSING